MYSCVCHIWAYICNCTFICIFICFGFGIWIILVHCRMILDTEPAHTDPFWKCLSLFLPWPSQKTEPQVLCLFFFLSNIHNMFQHCALITWYLTKNWPFLQLLSFCNLVFVFSFVFVFAEVHHGRRGGAYCRKAPATWLLLTTGYFHSGAIVHSRPTPCSETTTPLFLNYQGQFHITKHYSYIDTTFNIAP